MINIKQLHSLFKDRINRGSTNFGQDFTPMQIDNYINNGVQVLLAVAANRTGIEKNEEWVSPLAVEYPDQDVIVPVMVDSNKWVIDLDRTLKYPYYRYRSNSFVNQGCGYVPINFESERKIGDLIKDSLQAPSKAWGVVYGYVAKDRNELSGRSLYLITEPDTAILDVKLSYYRQPKPVFFGGYNSVEYQDCVSRGGLDCSIYNNIASPIVDLEYFSSVTASLIVDYAVAEAQRIIGNVDGYNLAQQKIVNQ